MATEKKLQNKIINYLKHLEKQEILYFEKRQAGGFSYHKGAPDIWIVIQGVHIEIELKSETGERTPLQIKWEKKIKACHTLYFCINKYEDFIIILNSIRESLKKTN